MLSGNIPTNLMKNLLLSFTTWCNKHKLDFLSVEPECKALKGQNQKIRFRHLNVLDEKYHGNDKVTYK